jgi:DNA/RNA-binding domain of Phe-tRNA-synthetase-like protein
MLTVAEHPLLDLRAFMSEFPRPIGEMESPGQLLEFLSLESQAPVVFHESVKPRVRDLLRFGGYKPTGRSKPAPEYLRQAVEKGTLKPINLAVDACNVASLHSGLPISVVDLDRTDEPLQISIAPSDSEYVFNATGQIIQLDGLLCLFDAQGPCANGVKDSQRTKTADSTTRTLSIVWGTRELSGHSEQTADWYRRLLESAGVKTIPARVLPCP